MTHEQEIKIERRKSGCIGGTTYVNREKEIEPITGATREDMMGYSWKNETVSIFDFLGVFCYCLQMKPL